MYKLYELIVCSSCMYILVVCTSYVLVVCSSCMYKFYVLVVDSCTCYTRY